MTILDSGLLFWGHPVETASVLRYCWQTVCE